MSGAARKRAVPVLLPYPLAGPFDYRAPEGMEVAPGDLVLVPLHRRREVGVVWDPADRDEVPESRLKPIEARLEAPVLRAPMRRFIDWVAAYTLTPPGLVLAMALRVNALRPESPPVGWRRAESAPEIRLSESRRRVLAALAQAEPR